MTVWRKIITAAILFTLTASLLSCASSGGEAPGNTGSIPVPSLSVDPTGTPGPDTAPSGAKEPDRAAAIPSALELTRLMGCGINLGNTMEACDSRDRIPNRAPYVYETMWGQPVTTQAMITGMKNAGFKTLRIPVAWTNAMGFGVRNALDYENWDYTIDKAYLDRVEEIINYALSEDMYVIINNHWDHGWWSMFGHPEQSVRDIAMDIFVSMWTQIAERYKDYDHRLIFEPANEEWGNRFNDRTPFSPTGGVIEMDERYTLLTGIAQVFVDLVRATGGNNADRFLLIPGFNTDVVMTADDRFRMPDDPAGDKLLLSVHYYTPWSYCGDTSGIGHWGSLSEVREMNELLGMLARFTDMGYGVVLGEWGVLDNEGDDRLAYFTNFLDNCDVYGYAPMLWDTGGFYDKRSCAMRAPELAGLFLDRSLEIRGGRAVAEIVEDAKINIAWTLRKAADKPEVVIAADEAFAWIMFASGDWALQYSVGDRYRPENFTDGMLIADVEVTGEGIYTVAIDFTGTAAGHADGIAFSAVGIMNGEILFPGYTMELTEVLLNGKPVVFSGKPYTTNDNPVTTRVNLYNEWVDKIPPEARVPGGDLTGVTAVPMENQILDLIETLSVTFRYTAP